METKNVWTSYSEEQLKEADAFAREYMDFLDAGKTERECVDTLVNLIEKEGYVELNTLMESGREIKPRRQDLRRKHEQMPGNVPDQAKSP